MKKQKKSGKIRPLGDRIVIKELDEKETGRKTDAGIYIPDSVKEDKEGRRGKVVAVGPGRFDDGKRVPMDVKEGDTVIFSWGDKVTIDGEDYFVVSESSVLAVIK
jgi:chaperonin GroES